MFRKKLENTQYLNGLRELFEKFGVSKAHSACKLVNRRSVSLIYADGINEEQANEITAYMNKGYDYWCAFVAPSGDVVNKKHLRLVYSDGTFYE